MSSVENVADEIGGEERQAQKAGRIRAGQLFPSRQLVDADAVAGGEGENADVASWQ